MGFGEKERKPPVKEGDEVDLEILSVGSKGDGVAKIEGFVVFVPGTQTGQKVRARVTRVLPKMAIAELVTSEAPAVEAPVDTEDFGEE